MMSKLMRRRRSFRRSRTDLEEEDLMYLQGTCRIEVTVVSSRTTLMGEEEDIYNRGGGGRGLLF
jgi:hypothetical protein